MTDTLPILYNFRRCPYAMRARIALLSAGIKVQVREITLREKPAHMLEVSPKGTVPVLLIGERVIDESFDIMQWALAQNDPEGLLDMPQEGHAWIDVIEGPFKAALDRYKYASRFEHVDAITERDAAAAILATMNAQLEAHPWLFGDRPCLADFATLTFVRQYANVDRAWFDAQDWAGVKNWLENFLDSPRFDVMMAKYPIWEPESAPAIFG